MGNVQAELLAWRGKGRRRGQRSRRPETEKTGAEGMISPVTVGGSGLTNTTGKNLQIVLFRFFFYTEGRELKLVYKMC